MKKFICIIILLTALCTKAQYFDLQYPTLNSIQFKNIQANKIFKSYNGNTTSLENIVSQLNAINIDSIGFNDDISNIYILKAIVNLNKNFTKNAVLNILKAKKYADIDKNNSCINNSHLVFSLINKNLKAYSKSIEDLNQCNFKDDLVNYQVNYYKANLYSEIKNYDKVNQILLDIIPKAKNISQYDYIKCLSFLISNTSNNDDDALSLVYALKLDSVLNNANQSAPVEALMNSNIKYNLSKDESFTSFFAMQKIVNSNNIGFLYRKLGDYKNSEKFLLQSISNLKKYKNDDLFPEIKTNIGLTYTHLKRYIDADENYQLALKKYIEQKNTIKQAETYNIIAKNYVLSNKSLSAIQDCNTSISLSTTNNDYLNLSNSYFILSEVYALNSDYKQSQVNFKLYTDALNKYNNLISQQNKQKEENDIKANLLKIDAEDEISSSEKKELELVRIKLESKQKEQELLLIKQENEIKENTIKTQSLEKEQALKSLDLIKEQLEKEKLLKDYDQLNKEREIKGLENERNKSQIKLLNSERTIYLNEKALKDLEIDNNRKKQQILTIGLIALGLFLAIVGFGFYRNYKQRKQIEKANTQLQIIGDDLKTSINEINTQKKIIEDKNSLVMESINYSSKIQKSLLLNDKQLHDYFSHSFVIDLPRDIVGGDFYLVKKKGNLTYVAMVDCTGHGVPGSMISILGYQEINHIIDNTNYSPATILTQLNTNINKLVNSNESLGSDGMDVMLLEIDSVTKTVTFAGARSYLLIYTNNRLQEYKGDRISIGEATEASFTNVNVTISENDTIYLYTDGFQDQNAEGNNKRMGSKALKQKIEQINKMPLSTQKEELLKLFNEHKGNHKQTDDVSVLGFKPNLNTSDDSRIDESTHIKKVLNQIAQTENYSTNLLVNHGKINQDVVISIIKIIEVKLTKNYTKSFVTKIKTIVIEMLQNISKHQLNIAAIEPYFVIYVTKTQLHIQTGNVISEDSKVFLNDKLDLYKSFSKDELNSKYIETFKNTSLTAEGNAGLGLITILHKSNQNFKYDFTKINQRQYYYTIEVFFNKSEITDV